MAEAIVSGVLENLNSFTWPETRPDFGVPIELGKLSTAFKAIQVLVDDAEQRQGQEESSISGWLRKLKDVAHETDDMLNEWEMEAKRSRTHEGEFEIGNKVRNLFSPCFRCMFGRRIKKIRERVESISEAGKNVHRFRELRRRNEMVEGVLDDYIHGDMKYDKEKITAWLKSSTVEEKPQVMVITGLRGLGKTTLAKLVYDDDKVDAHFDPRVGTHFGPKLWVSVSNDSNIKSLIKQVITTVPPEMVPAAIKSEASETLETLETLQLCLSEILNGRRFLLVLDNMQCDDTWQLDYLMLPLQGGANGSKILVTTNDGAGIARAMQTTIVHYLKFLAADDSWSLFSDIAFRGRTDGERRELEVIGREVVRRCNGTPQTIKAIASLLRFKWTMQDWKKFLEHKTWDWDQDNFPILLLSYFDLPPQLKGCFLYCSVFPREHRIEKKMLIQLWMAEDLIPKNEINPWEKGAEYFDELLKRSFFVNSIRDDYGNTLEIQVHSSAYEFIQFVGGREFLTVDLGPSPVLPPLGTIRHLSLICGDDTNFFPTTLDKENALRTLIHLGDPKILSLPTNSFNDTRFLRTLDLSRTKITQLPNSIGRLKRLRYLNLSSTNIVKLPKSLCRLYFLQTLILSHSLLNELPTKIWKLSGLRHLEIDGTPLNYLPNQIGRLTSICILSEFIIEHGENGCTTITELGNLNLLQGQLVISYLDRLVNKEEAEQANLNRKKLLNSLILDCKRQFSSQSAYFKRHSNYKTLERLYQEAVEVNKSDESDMKRMEEVFEAIQPHEDLKRLEIWNYICPKFPSWIEEPLLTKLISLKLINCVNMVDLPPLGKLRFLSKLHVRRMDKVEKIGRGVCGDGDPRGFPKLECLTIEKMSNWDEWELKAKEGEMPCLTQLILRDCPRLKKLPPLPEKLRKLEFSNCRALEEIPHGLPLLEDLVLKGKEGVFRSFLPDLPSLLSLKIMLSPELTSLLHLLESGKLKKLKTLTISFCPKLESLHELAVGLQVQQWPALKELHISGCPLLTELFEKDEGEDRRWIAKKKLYIQIDNKIIQ